MNRTVLYLRLSREKQNEDYGESIQNQRLLLLDYAQKKQLNVIGEYLDEDYSGLTDRRPGFQKMLLDAEAGCFDIVLAKNQSRFSRNMQHIEKYLHREFRRYRVRFIGVTDGTDTADKANKKARQIYGLVNEWYCEDLSESVRAVLRKKMMDGQFIGSSAPYGYRKDVNDSHKLCPQEDERRIVREIFELYVSGNSMRGICRILEQNGIQSPSGKAQWNPVTIKRILTNEVYLGHLLQGKSTNRSYKDKSRIYFSKENWIRHQDVHEPLISEELFQMAQKRVKKQV